jgi:hypothetical protein
MGWKICLNTVLVDVDIQMVQIHKFSQTSSVASIKLPFGQRLVGVRVVFHIKMLSKLFAKKKMLIVSIHGLIFLLSQKLVQ